MGRNRNNLAQIARRRSRRAQSHEEVKKVPLDIPKGSKEDSADFQIKMALQRKADRNRQLSILMYSVIALGALTILIYYLTR